jgi:hypothetical protein
MSNFRYRTDEQKQKYWKLLEDRKVAIFEQLRTLLAAFGPRFQYEPPKLQGASPSFTLDAIPLHFSITEYGSGDGILNVRFAGLGGKVMARTKKADGSVDLTGIVAAAEQYTKQRHEHDATQNEMAIDRETAHAVLAEAGLPLTGTRLHHEPGLDVEITDSGGVKITMRFSPDSNGRDDRVGKNGQVDGAALRRLLDAFRSLRDSVPVASTPAATVPAATVPAATEAA